MGAQKIKTGGFTVIEVTIFLAITSLMLLIAFAGTGVALRNIRFTDSTRSVQGYFQKQYDDILNGVNARDSSFACKKGVIDPSDSNNAGASSCLLLGKLLDIQPGSSTLTAYHVIGTDAVSDPDSPVQAYNPSIVASSADTYTIPWLATVQGTKRADGKAINSVLFVRSPSTGEVSLYTFYRSAGATDIKSYVIPVNTKKSANICLQNADGLGGLAMIVLSGASGQDAISLQHDITSDKCNGVNP